MAEGLLRWSYVSFGSHFSFRVHDMDNLEHNSELMFPKKLAPDVEHESEVEMLECPRTFIYCCPSEDAKF